MKQLLGFMVGILCMSLTYSVFAQGGALNTLDPRTTAIDGYTQDIGDVFGFDIDGNPIKGGAGVVVGKSDVIQGKVDGIIDSPGTSYEQTLDFTMNKIKIVVDRALGLLALICVIYLVAQGIILLMNSQDEKAVDTALGSVKTVARVLGGIGLSWFLVTFAFYIVKLLT